MKNLLFMVLMLAFSWACRAQDSGKELPVTRSLSISESHTTSLLFPYPILGVDRGSQDILAQKPPGLENVLQIKAAQPEFLCSNLTVITSNGALYNFEVGYDPVPFTYAYDFSGRSPGALTNVPQVDNTEYINGMASMAYHDRGRIYLSESAYGITMSITGMYVEGDHFFYRLSIENDSPISYDIDGLKFFVRDQKRSRRTASQEIEVVPVSLWQYGSKVPARSTKRFVAVLPKITIPDKKNLYVQLTEKSGGRHIQLKLKNTKVAKVIPLPSFKD